MVVVAVEEGMRYRAADPHEADLSSLPREAGPTSDPREVGLATLGEGHGLAIIRHLFLLLGHNPCRCAQGDGRRVHLSRP